MSATLSQSQIAALARGFMDAKVLLVAVKLGLFARLTHPGAGLAGMSGYLAAQDIR